MSKLSRLSTVVVLIMISVFSCQIWAYSGGDGTEDNPYQIASVADMNAIVATPEDWSLSFILTADIDMIDIVYGPIGTSSVPFTGTFDGCGHVISNLVCEISNTGDVYAGLLGYVQGAAISNLNLENINISSVTTSSAAFSYAGSLVGYMVGGSINDCSSSGSVSASATKTYAHSFAGSLVGYLDCSMVNCYSSASVHSSSYYYSYAGGLAAYVSLSGSISNCYNTGSVIGDCTYSVCVGGLTGYLRGSIDKCYSTGVVSTSSTNIVYVGGLVGYLRGAAVSNSFWDLNTSGLTISAGGTGISTDMMVDVSTFITAGWDFSSSDGTPAIWRMAADGYPFLAWERKTDLNNNGMVDLYDFAMLARNWQMADSGYSVTDFDKSGVTDMADLELMLTDWPKIEL